MFGKGGGALSSWIKEFCQLVFIQTIQAFIYAMIITVIMGLYGEAETAAEHSENFDYATSLGLFSVIALLSVFKVEDLARKIFGFGPTKADHGNAIRSIAKTGLALKMGSRVLDNTKKIGTGAKNWLSAGKDAKNAAKRLDRRKDALLKDRGGNLPGESTSGESTSGGNATASVSTLAGDETKQLLEKRKRMLGMANNMRQKAKTMDYNPQKKAELLANADKIESRVRGIDDALNAKLLAADGSGTAGSGSSTSAITSGGSSGTTGDYHQKMLDLQEQYKKELSDAKKKRQEGFRTMTSGIMESTGAIIGGTAGALLGGADGNLDEALQGLGTGAGVGDTVGKFATDTSFGATDLVSGAVSATSGAIRDYSSSIKQQYADEKKAAISQMKDLNKRAQSEVDRINRAMSDARDNLEKDINLSASQTVKAMAKAVGRGSKKAYSSRHGGIRQLESGIKELENHIKRSSDVSRLDNNVESID